MIHSEVVCQLVKVSLRHDAVVDDEGIRQVATTDESHLEKRGYLTHKDEGAGGSKVGGKATEIVKVRRLRGDKFAAIEVYGSINRKTCRRGAGSRLLEHWRLDAEPAASLFVVIFYCFLYSEIIAGGILLKESYTMYLLYVEATAAVEDGKFGTVHLDQAVVNAASKEGCHGMLDGRHANAVILLEGDNGTS